jgi:DNA-binding NtrC family response regulator
MSAEIRSELDLRGSTVDLKSKILLVEEDPRDLNSFRVALEEQGFEVSPCTSFEDGVRRLGREPFDFILVSQGSRAFEGRAVVERAKQIDRETPVLVVTRCIDMPCYLEAMQLGALDYLEKPLTAVQLRRLVQSHVQPRAGLTSRSQVA